MTSQATEDSTNTSTPTDPVIIKRTEFAWIACQTTASVFTLVSLYLTIAAIYHRCKARRVQRTPNAHRDYLNTPKTISGRVVYHNNNNNSKQSKTRLPWTPPYNPSKTRMAAAREWLIIAAAITITLRMLSEQQVLNLSDRSNEVCNMIATIHVILYALPVAAIYTFLWVRQRIFYCQPPLSNLFDDTRRRAFTIKAISMAIIIVMIIAELVTALVFTLTISYKPAELGCERDEILLPEWGPWLMIMVFTGSFQVLLLALYIWPIIRMRYDKNNPAMRDSRVHGRSINLPRKAIKRACCITAVCVASDALAALVTFATAMPTVSNGVVSNLVFDLNLIVNLVGITCTFRNWRHRLFPFCSSTACSRDTEGCSSHTSAYSAAPLERENCTSNLSASNA